MASTRDLVETQTHERRRLHTAFTRGVRGEDESEPATPLRGAVAGSALTVLLVLGGRALGLLGPALPDGWDEASLVIVREDGSRYVGVDGTLHPVPNVASARLLADPGAFHLVHVGADDIAGVSRGPALGIPGAPDALPPVDRLVTTGWLACLTPEGGTSLTLAPDSTSSGTDLRHEEGAAPVLIRAGDALHLVVDGVRHHIPAAHEVAVLRALGLEPAEPVPASETWLGLLPSGADLAPLHLPGAGQYALPAVGLPVDTRVGTVVEVSGLGADVRRYAVDARGELAPLSDLAHMLYLLGADPFAAEPLRVTASDIAAIPTAATPVAPADWPERVPAPPTTEGVACARWNAEAERVDLVLTTGDPPIAGVHVAPGAGALVRLSDLAEVPAEVGTAAPHAVTASEPEAALGSVGSVLLIDDSGRAFPLPEAGTGDEVLIRLGYGRDDVTPVPRAWAALLPAGPALTTRAASTRIDEAAAGS